MLQSIDTKSHIYAALIRNVLCQNRSLVHCTFFALGALTFLLAGCVPSANRDLSSETLNGPITRNTDNARLRVVATNTVLADIANNVGGELVSLTSLVPAGADVHTFQSTPSHSITIAEADLIISNGAGLDDFLIPILTNAQAPGSIHIVASKGLEPFLDSSEESAHHDAETKHHPGEESAHHDAETKHHPGHDHSGIDPHFWLDPTLAIHYVERIIEGLTKTDPKNAQQYTANGKAYIEQLHQLDQEISETLAQIPPSNRHLVTFHDAYGYFARRYEWQVSSFVPSDASDVTPSDIVSIIEQINPEGIPAVFAEPQLNSDVLQQASQDARLDVGIIRSLVDDQTLTYVDMMRQNARSLVENLGSTKGYYR